jgi:hypothetical protein
MLLRLRAMCRDIPSGIVLEKGAAGNDWDKSQAGYAMKMKGVSDSNTRYVREGAKPLQEDDEDVEYA